MKSLIVAYDEKIFTEKDALYLASFGASNFIKNDRTQDVVVSLLSSPKNGQIESSLNGTVYTVTEHRLDIEKREKESLEENK